MRKLFVSYARENKRDVDQLVEHLSDLGYETWFDSSLRGGQDWWEEILRRITDCDVFIAIISRDALDSTACRHEFEWAEALGKPVLPVAVEPVAQNALPRRFATRQIIDYSDPGLRDRAAVRLGGSLVALPPAPPLPDPLPQPPETPLSYLTGLVDLVEGKDRLTQEQQRQLLIQLEPALNSVDPQERQRVHDILERFSRRDDLYADADRTIARLKARPDVPAEVAAQQATADSSARDSPDQLSREHQPLTGSTPPPDYESGGRPPGDPAPEPRVKPKSQPKSEKAAVPQGESPSGTPPTRPGTPWIKRVAALVIELIPVLIVIWIGATIQGTTRVLDCHYDSAGIYQYCSRGNPTILGQIALAVAIVVSLVYLVWNYGYRLRRSGSSIGMSLLSLKRGDQ
jgi:TIR domain